MHSINSQKGAALIVAMFIMSLVAACAVAMMMRLNIDIHRTQLIFNSEKGDLYAQGSVAMAKDFLIENLRKAKPSQATDKLPLTDTLVTDGLSVSYSLSDCQGKFNVNNMKDDKASQAFARLLHLIDPNLTQAQIAHLVLALKDWLIKKDDTMQRNFAKGYENTNPRYQAPHSLMASISELRLLSGMNAALYEKLIPYVTALPKEHTLININSASLPVLVAVLDAPPQKVQALFAAAKENPFQNKDDRLPRYGIDTSQITFQSDYFLLESNVKVAQQNIQTNTLLARNSDNKQPQVTTLWQMKGTL